jgi:O-methyltransferase involved in polyketide biosynthesis
VPDAVRALWICEGLLGYLSRDELRALAETAAALSEPGAWLVANYSRTAWSTEIVEAVFSAAGWRPVETPTFADLHRQHLGAEPPPGSEPFAFLEAVRVG